MKLTRGSLPTLYLISVQIMLLFTAAFKLVTASLSDAKLGQPDYVLWMFSNRQVLMLASCIEISVVLFLAKWSVQKRSLELIMWLGSVFVIYRLFRWMSVGSNLYSCNCFGGFLLRTGDKISLGILVWMLVGSLALLLFQRSWLVREHSTVAKKG